MDNNGSSNSSFPNSSWVDWSIDWKGTSRTTGPFDPSAPLLPVLPALEVPLAAAWVCSKTSGFGLFDVPAISALDILTDGFSISPIIGDSGIDRIVDSGSFCTQLRKSWIWSFSCAGRVWILAKQDSKWESWGKQDASKRISDSYWPASRRGIFLCNKDPKVAFRFLLSSEAALAEVGGIQYHVL